MRKRSPAAKRKGTVVPLVVLALVGLFGFTALAIDLGMICVARTQCQNAADAAAVAGCGLSGDPTTANNAANAVLKTVEAATDNTALSKALDPSTVTVQVGAYTYDPVAKKFPTYPFPNLVTVPPGSSPGRNSTDNWSLIQATVNYRGNYAFARVFGLTNYDISTRAVAAHRPRDVAIILDFSGSMRFGSLLGSPYSGRGT